MFSNFCEASKNQPDLNPPFVKPTNNNHNNNNSNNNNKLSDEKPLNRTSPTTLSWTGIGSNQIFSQESNFNIINSDIIINSQHGSIFGAELPGAAQQTINESSQIQSHSQDDELDAITAVFALIIGGSARTEQKLLDSEIEKYRQLYKNSAANTADADLLVKQCTKLISARRKKRELSKPINLLYNEAIKKYGNLSFSDSNNFSAFKENGTFNGFQESLELEYDGLHWCNGLLCKGMCNSAYCSSICLKLWEEKVRNFRKQAVLRDIVERNKTSNLVIQTHFLRLNPSLQVPISLKPKALIKKHPHETESQYLQRKAICELQEQADREALLQVVKPKPLPKSRRNEKDVRGPMSLTVRMHGKNRLAYASAAYAKKESADAATFAIARYYAKMQKKMVAKRVRNAIQVIRPHLLRFIFLYRQIKFIQSVVIIQSLARGLYIRNRIPALVEALIQRKIERLLACIRIRRFFRQNADDIYNSRRGLPLKRCTSSLSTISACVIDQPVLIDNRRNDEDIRNVRDSSKLQRSSSNFSVASTALSSIGSLNDNDRNELFIESSQLANQAAQELENSEESGIHSDDINGIPPLSLSQKSLRMKENMESEISKAVFKSSPTRTVSNLTLDDFMLDTNSEQQSPAAQPDLTKTEAYRYQLIPSVPAATAASNRALSSGPSFLSTGSHSSQSSISNSSHSSTNSPTPSYHTPLSSVSTVNTAIFPSPYGLQQASTLAGKAKEFLQFGKVVHSRNPSYNSTLQTLLYSKYLADSSSHSTNTSSTHLRDISDLAKHSNTSVLQSPLAAATTAYSSDISPLKLKDSKDLNAESVSNSEQTSFEPTTEAQPNPTEGNAVNSVSSIIFPSMLQIAPQESNISPIDDVAAEGAEVAVSRAHSDDLDNISFCQYPIAGDSSQGVRMTVPLLDDQYDSSDDDEDNNSRNDLPNKGSHNNSNANNSKHSISSLNANKKPNLIGSIKMEEYFVRSFRDEVENLNPTVGTDSRLGAATNPSSFSASGVSTVPSYISALEENSRTVQTDKVLYAEQPNSISLSMDRSNTVYSTNNGQYYTYNFFELSVLLIVVYDLTKVVYIYRAFITCAVF